MQDELFDVLVVGAGPAGLSGALWLGRCRRKVLVCDDGRPRNKATRAAHGFLTRDGVEPAEIRRLAREELLAYDIQIRDLGVETVLREGERFRARLASGTEVLTRKVLIASGAEDVLPGTPGFEPLYGRSAFHCPYCDGWEQRDRPLAALAHGREGVEFALGLLTWSRDVQLFLDGGRRPPRADLVRLERAGIAIHPERIACFEGEEGQLRRIVLKKGGASIPREALFFHLGQRPRTDLALRLGCTRTRHGTIRQTPLQGSGVPGVFIAGDLCRDVNFLIVAAAEGAKAAFAINRELREEETP